MRTSFAFPLLHVGVSNAVAVVADVAETSTTGNWWLIHWCKQSSRCCIWFHHQGRSHENLSGQVTLPQHIYSLVPRRFFAQHSSIVSIKIVSGFSTCNNNRTNYSLWKLEREIEWMMRFFWKIRQRTHDDSKRYSRAQTNVRARGSSAPPWAPPHVHVKWGGGAKVKVIS